MREERGGLEGKGGETAVGRIWVSTMGLNVGLGAAAPRHQAGGAERR